MCQCHKIFGPQEAKQIFLSEATIVVLHSSLTINVQMLSDNRLASTRKINLLSESTIVRFHSIQAILSHSIIFSFLNICYQIFGPQNAKQIFLSEATSFVTFNYVLLCQQMSKCYQILGPQRAKGIF